MQQYARAIPGITINQQELRIDYPNGGQVRIYGSDNEDSLRGIYSAACRASSAACSARKSFALTVGANAIIAVEVSIDNNRVQCIARRLAAGNSRTVLSSTSRGSHRRGASTW